VCVCVCVYVWYLALVSLNYRAFILETQWALHNFKET